MITVSILINGNPILTRSAVNKGKLASGLIEYKCDDGSQILHRPEEGAVKLAKRMLDTIKDKEISSLKIES